MAIPQAAGSPMPLPPGGNAAGHLTLMKSLSSSIVLLSLACIGGCGRQLLLPGHTEQNLAHPPNLTMAVGERRKAIQDGFFWWPVVEPLQNVLSSSDPNTVIVENSESHSVYLVAAHSGQATLKYYAYKLDGPGFTVTVLPTK